jgi:hypothetical protein
MFGCGHGFGLQFLLRLGGRFRCESGFESGSGRGFCAKGRKPFFLNFFIGLFNSLERPRKKGITAPLANPVSSPHGLASAIRAIRHKNTSPIDYMAKRRLVNLVNQGFYMHPIDFFMLSLPCMINYVFVGTGSVKDCLTYQPPSPNRDVELKNGRFFIWREGMIIVPPTR